MSNSRTPAYSNNHFANGNLAPKVIADNPEGKNSELDNSSPGKKSLNRTPDSSPSDRRDEFDSARLSKLTFRVNELEEDNQRLKRQLENLENLSGPIIDNLLSTVETLQLKTAQLEGANQAHKEEFETWKKWSYQTEQQRQYDRIDDNKTRRARAQARQQQTEERIKNHLAAAVRPLVEEIIPQRNRSYIPEPARQPKNPPMPMPSQLDRVEVMAGVVPRLVMYGLIAIFSCLIAVFLFNPGFFDYILRPTQTTFSILLFIIILSGGAILFANSQE